MAFTLVTVSATYLEPDNVTPLSGTVTFQLAQDITDGAGGRILASRRKVATLDSAGLMSVQLAATDDATTAPQYSVYLVTESFVGVPTNCYFIEVPSASPTLNLALAAHVDLPSPYQVMLESALAAVTAGLGNLSGYVKSALVTATDASTITFDLAAGSRQKVTLGGNRTLAVTGDAANPLFTIVLETGAGNYVPVWWSGINWEGGAAPTVTTTANRRDVFSFIRLGVGDYLGFVVGQDLASSVAPTVPAVPTGITAVAGNASASVSFTPGSNGGAARDGCRITPYVGSTAGTPQVFSTTATTQTVTGLTNGTAYTFKVEDHNTVGYSTPLSAASNSVTPSNLTAPAAPTIGTATAGDTQATIAFTQNSNGGSVITGGVVTPYIAGVAQAPQTFAFSASMYTVTGLTNGTAYTFKVALTNAINTGPQSAASNSVTPAAPSFTTYVSDTFTRADGTALEGSTCDTGQTWETPTFGAGLQTIGGKLQFDPAAINDQKNGTILTGHGDFRVSVTLVVMPTVGRLGLSARGTSGYYYRALVSPDGSAQLMAGPTVLGTAAPAGTFSAGDVITLVMNGSNLSVLRNGVAVSGMAGTNADDTTTGRAGIFDEVAGNVWRLDNFLVTSLT